MKELSPHAANGLARFRLDPLEQRVLLSADSTGVAADAPPAGPVPGIAQEEVQLPGDLADVADLQYAPAVAEDLWDTESDEMAAGSGGAVQENETHDLAIEFGKTDRLPHNLLEGMEHTLTLPVVLSNQGNASLGLGATTMIEIIARPVDGGDDVSLRVLEQSASNMRVGQIRKINIKVTLPATLNGDYLLVAKVDDVNPAGNEAVRQTPLGIHPPFLDLVAGVGSRVRLPDQVISGDGTKLRLPLEITNRGNIPIPKGQIIQINLLARPEDGGEDVLLSTYELKQVSNLKPDKIKKFNLQGTLPIGLQGTHRLVAQVDTPSPGTVDENFEDNNEAVTEQTIAVEEGFYDLTAAIGSRVNLPISVVAGTNTPISLPVEVTNQGNVSLPAGQKIDITILARPTDGGEDMLITTVEDQNVSRLRPGAVKRLTLRTSLPVGLEGDYHLVAQVDTPSPGSVDEKFEDNNEAVTEQTIAVYPPFLDLTAAVSSKAKLPEFLLAGDGTKITLPVEVRNEGNVAIPSGQSIAVQVVASPVNGGAGGQVLMATLEDVDVATFTKQSISNLRPGAVKKLNLKIDVPAGLKGYYQLVALVDTDNQVAEKNEANNDAGTSAETPVRVLGDFLEAAMLDVPGANWLYAGNLTTNRPIGGSGYITAEVFGAGLNTYRLVEEAHTIGGSFDTETQTYTFQRSNDGVFLLRRVGEIDIADLVFSYGDLQLSPSQLLKGKTHKDASPASLDIRVMGTSVDLDGSASVTTRLAGYKPVTYKTELNGDQVRSQAAVISLNLSTNVSGFVDTIYGYRLMTVRLTENITYYAVPDVGLAKVSNRVSISVGVQGAGTERASGSENRLLIGEADDLWSVLFD